MAKGFKSECLRQEGRKEKGYKKQKVGSRWVGGLFRARPLHPRVKHVVRSRAGNGERLWD